MIERKFITENIKEFQIREFISESLKNVGHSHTKVTRTPLGEKVIIFASRPGLIVGRKGQNIKQLTRNLKKKFNLENPEIEISEVENIFFDANIMAEKIADSLERFGSSKFKAVGHKVMNDIMNAGALGVEITISGKIPSSRAKTWRFYSGYLKKCGDIALVGVNYSYAAARLKSGIVGVKVRIMPSTTKLPDNIQFLEEKQEIVEEVAEEPAKEEKKEEKPEDQKDAEDKGPESDE